MRFDNSISSSIKNKLHDLVPGNWSIPDVHMNLSNFGFLRSWCIHNLVFRVGSKRCTRESSRWILTVVKPRYSDAQIEFHSAANAAFLARERVAGRRREGLYCVTILKFICAINSVRIKLRNTRQGTWDILASHIKCYYQHNSAGPFRIYVKFSTRSKYYRNHWFLVTKASRTVNSVKGALDKYRI